MINNKQRYTDLISVLGFKEKNSEIKDPALGLYVAIGELNLRDVILKVVPKTEVGKVRGFYKEALVDNIIDKHNRDLANLIILKARVLAVGQNEHLAWIMRRFYTGQALSVSKNKKHHLIERLATIEKPYLADNTILDKIVSNLISLQKLTTDLRKFGIRKEYFSRRFKVDLAGYNIKLFETGLGINLDNQIKYYEKHCKEYFDKQNVTACTGDMTPSNIICKKDGQLIFSDFEWFCLDNKTVDTAFLWLFLYKYKKWQKQLITSLITNEMDRNHFRLSVMRIILYWFNNAFESDDLDKQSVMNRKYFRKHVWARYLDATGESFEALMKVK